MSREAFGDPPESQEPPQVCPLCGGEWHAEDCEFGKEVARRLKAERDAHKMAFEHEQLHADLRDFLLHVVDMSKGDHYWDVVRGNAEALLRRDVLKKRRMADDPEFAAAVMGGKTPNKPLRRGVDGVCTRSTCECERDGLGDQCVWLKPVEAEFECLGEPSLCTNPRGCACSEEKP